MKIGELVKYKAGETYGSPSAHNLYCQETGGVMGKTRLDLVVHTIEDGQVGLCVIVKPFFDVILFEDKLVCVARQFLEPYVE